MGCSSHWALNLGPTPGGLASNCKDLNGAIIQLATVFGGQSTSEGRLKKADPASDTLFLNTVTELADPNIAIFI